jgi:hypothetical protein
MRKPRINRGYKEPIESIPEPVIDQRAIDQMIEQRVIDQRVGRTFAEIEGERQALAILQGELAAGDDYGRGLLRGASIALGWAVDDEWRPSLSARLKNAEGR